MYNAQSGRELLLLQPCWSVNVIIHDHSEHCTSGVDERNPMIRVNLCSCAVARCEIAHILLYDICSDVCSPSFSCDYPVLSVHGEPKTKIPITMTMGCHRIPFLTEQALSQLTACFISFLISVPADNDSLSGLVARL